MRSRLGVLSLLAAALAVAALITPWTPEPRVLVLALLTATRRRGRFPIIADVVVAAVSLVTAAGAAVTLPLGTCFWDDSMGGGASESIWGPAPVLLLAAAVLVAVIVGRRNPRRRGAAE